MEVVAVNAATHTAAVLPMGSGTVLGHRVIVPVDSFDPLSNATKKS